MIMKFNLIDATINNETLPSSYYQQAKPLPTGNPMMIIASDYPVACDCPHCHHSIVTKVEKNNGLFAWLVASGLCLAGCCCGCCLIPFCIDDLKV
jgi:hypothetical protein